MATVHPTVRAKKLEKELKKLQNKLQVVHEQIREYKDHLYNTAGTLESQKLLRDSLCDTMGSTCVELEKTLEEVKGI